MEFPVTIQDQDQFDGLVKNRIAREREKWEKESGVADAHERANKAETEGYRRVLRRDARDVLRGMGVPDNRHERIIGNATLPDQPGEDGEPDKAAITSAFKDLHGEVPELFGEGARVADTALDTGAGDDDRDAPLTRERVENMTGDEINSNWDRVKAFLAGQR